MGREIQAIKISGEDRRTYRAKLARALDVVPPVLHQRMFRPDPAVGGPGGGLNPVDGPGLPPLPHSDVAAAVAHPARCRPEAACPSVQLHLQASPEAFASYWNAAKAIAGVQVALAANSPFLFWRQLWHETRITLFEQATDTRPDELKRQGVRPRVWFGERWITSVFDLFEENIQYFPALLPICEDEDPQAVLDDGGCPQLSEMSLHNGTIYRWNRPVYAGVGGNPHVRAGDRGLPAGASVV